MVKVADDIKLRRQILDVKSVVACWCKLYNLMVANQCMRTLMRRIKTRKKLMMKTNWPKLSQSERQSKCSVFKALKICTSFISCFKIADIISGAAKEQVHVLVVSQFIHNNFFQAAFPFQDDENPHY